eukprot:TCONS_00011362-protein
MRSTICVLCFMFLRKTLLTYAQNNDYSCYDFLYNPRVCLPGPIDIAENHEINVDDKYTCGTPTTKYCRSAEPSGCFICNASSTMNSHPVRHMTDKDFPLNFWDFGYKPTWWQSITWWDAKQMNILTDGTLKINLTLSMNKSYDLTGSIQLTFYSSKPHAFVIERSSDFGNSWKPYRYYADQCALRFPRIKLESQRNDEREVYCIEHQSLDAVQGSQVKFEPSYTKDNFWSKDIQDYITATDFRISLQYPWTDNNEKINQESFLNKYYYDITDVQIHGRCHCNGHAPYCDSNKQCFCQHNTAGTDCEKCIPLFNNKPWKPAEASNKPNPCEACNCNNHAGSCHYNETLEHGVCDECRNGTTGYHCERCDDFHYRNISLPINDERVCIACDCFLPGTTNNGKCLQNSTINQAAGQCPCKPNVFGMRCDECKDGYFGLRLSPDGNCEACNCSINGTIQGETNCDQQTGKCRCKPTIGGRTCSQCQPGYFNFPETLTDECEECDCKIGGSYNETCDQETGSCYCRFGISGRHCDQITSGTYVPSFNHYILEAEQGGGLLERISDIDGYGQRFSGYGYALVNASGSVELTFTPDMTRLFHIQIRYKELVHPQNITMELHFSNTGSTIQLISTANILQRGSDKMILAKVILVSGGNYTFKITNIDTNDQSMMLDSLVLLPDYEGVDLHRNSGPSVEELIANCWNESLSSMTFEVTEGCKDVVFSTNIEIYDGSQECKCDTIGSWNTTCETYGGQCYCKEGVMGRKCDQCMAGYFNFTTNGCQKCECDSTGSTDFACNVESGQCSCKKNIITRTCSQCQTNYFGFGTLEGCRDCGCNMNGSSSLQCLDNGICVCKESTQGQKCDRCQINYYGFSGTGCNRCGCNEDGSVSLQCDQDTGKCSCKSNVIIEKCSSCKTGYFNLMKENHQGCQECFCFNKTDTCSSASGYELRPIPSDLFDWTQINGGNFETSEAGITFNMTGGYFVLSAPQEYLGNRLYILQQELTLEFNFDYQTSVSVNRSVSLILIGGTDNFFLSYTINNITSGVGQKASIRIDAENADLDSWKIQAILADLESLQIQFQGTKGDVGIFQKLTMMKVVPVGNDAGDFGGVEHCQCPQNYTGVSCQTCSSGYTREKLINGPFDRCVLCSCNARSTDCNPETGICSNCQHGTEGDHCERCQPNVEEPDCEQCSPGFYGYNNPSFVGCKACDCIGVNTINNRTDVCDLTTGQCPCKEDIGGRRCDRCAENAVNISHACTACSLCHGLIQDEVHLLRQQIKTFQLMVQNATRAVHLVSNDTFPELLTNLSSTVLRILSEVKSTAQLEHELYQEFDNLGDTLEELETRLEINITQRVNIIRAQSSNIMTHENQTRDTMNTIHDFLWFSVYIINTELTPKSGNASILLKQLQDLADNFTSIATKRISSYAPVLLNIDQLFNASNQILVKTAAITNISMNIDSNLTNTKSELTDFSRAVSGQRMLSSSLYNTSLEILNLSKDLLANITRTGDEIQDLDVNSAKTILNDLQSRNETLYQSLYRLKDHLQNLQETFTSLMFDSKRSLNHSSMVLKSANTTVKETETLHKQVSQIREGVLNASKVSNTTFGTAQRMLVVLMDYENAIINSSQSLKDSMAQLDKLNKSSIETIEYVKSMKLQVTDIFGNVSKVFNKSTDLQSRTNEQRQDALNVLTTFRDLEKKPVFKTNMTEIRAMFRKINSIGYEGYALSVRCNATSSQVLNLTKQAKDSLKWASEAKSDQLKQAGDVLRLFEEMEKIGVLNSTHFTELNNEINQSRDVFQQMSLTHALMALRKARDDQKIKIESQRQSAKEMKEEIGQLRQLYEQMKNTKGCG